MSVMLMHLLLAGGPPWLVWNLVATEPAPVVNTATEVVQVVEVEPDDEDATRTFVVQGGESGTQMVFVRAEPAAGATDGRSHAKVVRVLKKSDGAEEGDRGWLGVTIDGLPEALVAQLSDKQGVLVTNVATGSPADKAGFQPNDVIVAINGAAVASDLHQAVDLIKSNKPGETVNIVVLRNGQQTNLTATLGSRAELGGAGFTWKFETGPEGEVAENVRTRGKLLQRGPGGAWVFKDLGDLSLLHNLPDNIKMMLPQSGERSTTIHIEDGAKTLKTSVERDGTSISVEQKDDGPITVTRTDAGGKVSAATFEDEDALEDSDAEAYRLFSQAGHAAVIHLDADGALDGELNVTMDLDADSFMDFAHEWHEGVSGGLEEAHEAYQKAMEELHSAMQTWKEQGWTEQLKKFHELSGKTGDGSHGMGAFTFFGEPRNTFEQRTDGTIEARVRKGDSELVQLYKNEADLKQRNPDLYAKYEELKSVKE